MQRSISRNFDDVSEILHNAFIFSFVVISLAQLFNIPYVPIFRGGLLGERYNKHPKIFNHLFFQLGFLLSKKAAINLWDFSISKNVAPCGLGARDTLRLEAGMHLYGQDINEETSPYEAGLGWLVHLENNHEFFGRRFLEEQSRLGIQKKLVGLSIEGKAIGRKGCAVLKGEENIGSITSGSWSPTKQQAIAFAYINTSHALINNEVQILIRGKKFKGVITKRAFYKKNY